SILPTPRSINEKNRIANWSHVALRIMEAKDRLYVAVGHRQYLLIHPPPPDTVSSLSCKETASDLLIPTIFHVCRPLSGCVKAQPNSSTEKTGFRIRLAASMEVARIAGRSRDDDDFPAGRYCDGRMGRMKYVCLGFIDETNLAEILQQDGQRMMEE